jgi:hypothetical protein
MFHSSKIRGGALQNGSRVTRLPSAGDRQFLVWLSKSAGKKVLPEQI